MHGTNNPEIEWYAEICRHDYPDSYHTCAEIYGQTPQAVYAAAEHGYFYVHHRLPLWGLHLEHVYQAGGAYVFVHQGTDKQ